MVFFSVSRTFITFLTVSW